MFHAHDRNAPHWSEDLVEHIRTVHFALVAVCLGLIGLIQFQKPRDVSIAQFQLQEIMKAVDAWDTPQVVGQIRDAFGRAGVYTTSPPVLFWLEADGQSFGVIPQGVAWVSGEGNRKVRALDTNELLKNPKSLADFQRVWDVLAGSVWVTMPDTNKFSQTLVRSGKDGKTSLQGYTKLDSPRSGWRSVDWVLPTPEQSSAVQTVLHSSVDMLYVIKLEAGDTLLLPVGVSSKQQVYGLTALQQTHPYWKTAPFASSFAELNSATTTMQDQSFEYIAGQLAKEAAKPKTDSFEIFGVKFPVETASRWGIVVIVGIQLYLWIHLYELSPKLKGGDPGWDVAWIGVYQSLPARIVFLSSTALLPIGTIVLLGTHALKGAGYVVWAIYILALLASLVLSPMIARGIPTHEGSAEPVAVDVSSRIETMTTTPVLPIEPSPTASAQQPSPQNPPS
jgi:hypothetical protein